MELLGDIALVVLAYVMALCVTVVLLAAAYVVLQWVAHKDK